MASPNFVRNADPNMIEAAIAACPLGEQADAIVVALPPLAESGDVLEAWPGEPTPD